ncbi:MAG TPA: serine hydrolase [Candidatus Binatia bacterium]|nr:serine hydrolase [Candidatus Binatia bacterium]
MQLTPDGVETLVSKDVNGEHWSIVADRAQGRVWANVYGSGGEAPQFVSCLETSRAGGAVHLRCKGTRGCEPWVDLAEVALPESFFHPPADCSAGDPAPAASGDRPSKKTPGSGLRLTPDEKMLLVGKDVGGAHWTIARAPRGFTLAGSASPLDGGPSQFVWCKESDATGDDRIFACSTAPGCRCGSCPASGWSAAGEVTLPRTFLEDRRCADGAPKPDPPARVVAPAGDGVAFGSTVAISSDTAAIATVVGRDRRPAVDVFQRAQGRWRRRTRLQSPDRADGDFGVTIALAGRTIVVGGKRRAYVFELGIDGSKLSAQIDPFTDADDEGTITAVATDGDVAVVAATYPVNAALVFERAGGGWRQVAALRRESISGYAAPLSLALEGDTLAVGDTDGCGAVLVYRHQQGSWNRVAAISAPTCPGASGFGASVALSGSTLLVGADPHIERDQRSHDGAAFVFEQRDGAWRQVSMLHSCARDLGRFGSTVGLSKDRALVGAASYYGGGSAGDVVVFEPGAEGWREKGRLVASDAAETGEDFVAVSASTVLVGAPQEKIAYAFDLASGALAPPEPCAPAPTPTPRPTVWPLAGWSVEPPEQHGMSAVVLDGARRYAFQPGKSTQAVVVVRHGVIVAEWYEPGRDPSSFAASWSVAKSFAGALIGIAIGEGKIESVDASLARFIPEWSGTDKEAITLRDVLRMESGLTWTEDYSVFQTDLSDIAVLASQVSDQLAYVLSKPLGRPPGTFFAYSSADSMLLSRVIEVATGMRAAEYARKVLFDPLAMAPVDWWSDVPGHTLTYCCIDTPSRELAKFGLLYAREGLWGDRQVVPAEWVRESTSPRGSGYGYQWWLPVTTGIRGTEDFFEALGFDGQYIDVFPSLDLVVVRSGHYEKDSGPPIADPTLFARYPAAGLGNGRGTIPPDEWSAFEFLRPIFESIFE